MKTQTTLAIVLAATTFLVGCSIGITRNSNTIKHIKEVSLADGTVTRIGFKPVEDAWHCTILGKHAANAAMNKIKGTLSFSDPFKVMSDQAIDYANENHLQPNYIYLYLPLEVAVGKLDTSLFSDAQSTFYNCETPPDINDNIMNLFK